MAWNGSDWRLRDADTGPSARTEASMAFDAGHAVTPLFGSFAPPSSAPIGDTWEWNGLAWPRQTPPASPFPRASAAMAFDPTRLRTVLLGGRTGFTAQHQLNEPWERDGATWRAIAARNLPPALLSPLRNDEIVSPSLLAAGETVLHTLDSASVADLRVARIPIRRLSADGLRTIRTSHLLVHMSDLGLGYIPGLPSGTYDFDVLVGDGPIGTTRLLVPDELHARIALERSCNVVVSLDAMELSLGASHLADDGERLARRIPGPESKWQEHRIAGVRPKGRSIPRAPCGREIEVVAGGGGWRGAGRISVPHAAVGEVSLAVSPTRSLSGRVVNAAGQGRSGRTVWLDSGDARAPRESGATEETGAFRTTASDVDRARPSLLVMCVGQVEYSGVWSDRS